MLTDVPPEEKILEEIRLTHSKDTRITLIVTAVSLLLNLLTKLFGFQF